jgi:hypothetical protein
MCSKDNNLFKKILVINVSNCISVMHRPSYIIILFITTINNYAQKN